MMLSHPFKCLKDIPNTKKKHVGSMKYVCVCEGGGGGGEAYKKIIAFYLANFLG